MAEYSEFHMAYIMPLIKLIISITIPIITGMLAVKHGYVSVYIPLISETATASTQRNLFTLAGSLIAILSVFCFLTKYTIFKRLNPIGAFSVLNKSMVLCGLFSTFGLLLLIAFPINPLGHLHSLGATVFFFFSTLYILQDGVFLMKYQSNPGTKNGFGCNTHKFKLVIAIILIVLCITFVISYIFGKNLFYEKNETPISLKTPDDSFFFLVSIGCLSEWMIYFFYCIYISSCVADIWPYTLIVVSLREEEFIIISSPEIVNDPIFDRDIYVNQQNAAADEHPLHDEDA